MRFIIKKRGTMRKECEWCYTESEMIQLALERQVISDPKKQLCDYCYREEVLNK